MSSPASFMRPRSGRIAPEIRLKNVVLPAPFGPIIAVSEPAGEVERDILHGGDAAEGFREVLDLQHGRHLCACGWAIIWRLRRAARLGADTGKRHMPVPRIEHHVEQSAPQPEREQQNHDAEREPGVAR